MIELFLIISLGLVFGSFATCMSYRLPRGENLVVKPSFCPACSTKLGLRDLVPLVSWLASLGRCRHCGARISLRYPLTELASMAAFLLVYSQHGLSMQALLLCAMAVALLIMIVVDFEHFIMPDSVHVALIPLALAYRYLQGDLWPDALIACAILLATALLLYYGYSALRGRQMLGFGDVKFFAVAGLWLPLAAIVPFLFFSGLLGVVLGLAWRITGRGEIFPFGPALGLSLFLCVLYPDSVNLLYYIN